MQSTSEIENPESRTAKALQPESQRAMDAHKLESRKRCRAGTPKELVPPWTPGNAQRVGAFHFDRPITSVLLIGSWRASVVLGQASLNSGLTEGHCLHQ